MLAPLVAQWVLLVAAVAPAAERPIGVVVELVGSDEDRAAFTASLSELVARLGLRLASPADGPALATVTLDLTPVGEGVLTVADGAGKVVLLRRLPRTEKAAVVREAAAHIAQSVVEELRDVERRQPLRAAQPAAPAGAEPAVTFEAPRPARVPGVALDLGVFIDGRLFGGSSPFAFGFGLNGAVAVGNTRFRPALWLSAGYHTPFQNSNDWAEVSTHAVALRLVPKVGLLGGDNWRLDAGLGGGADLFVSVVRSTVLPPQLVEAPRADASPVLTALVAGHLGVARSADLSLSFTLDVDLAPRRFVVDVAGTREALFDPWRVRPGLMLGFTLSPVGPDPYQGRAEDGA